jgi:hypothetical protein
MVREMEAPRGAFYYNNVLPDAAAMTLGASKAISRTAWHRVHRMAIARQSRASSNCLLNAACILRWSETGQPGADYAKNRESGVTDLELVHLINKSAKLSDRAGYQQHLNFKLRSPI